ncbi:MAG TPA: DUF3024 domain-containing protein [Vibrio sp.]|uniref:DUF3024 domain-containing protein n=1 Tax=Vibrio TaxID=662 RepID=UPI0004296434|nr:MULTISPECIES: DUF3024 domain-containing protein [Vibrio]HCH00396.1 DUF3024 domain-containing protein [Vibrio sp.]
MINELDWRRLLKRCEQLCHYRNGSVPVGQGKACFDSDEATKILIFSNAVFSVDSLHCSHTIEVAKLDYDANHEMWELYINSAEDASLVEPEWLPHPVHFAHANPMLLLSVIEKDAEECIWQ